MGKPLKYRLFEWPLKSSAAGLLFGNLDVYAVQIPISRLSHPFLSMPVLSQSFLY